MCQLESPRHKYWKLILWIIIFTIISKIKITERKLFRCQRPHPNTSKVQVNAFSRAHERSLQFIRVVRTRARETARGARRGGLCAGDGRYSSGQSPRKIQCFDIARASVDVRKTAFSSMHRAFYALISNNNFLCLFLFFNYIRLLIFLSIIMNLIYLD